MVTVCDHLWDLTMSDEYGLWQCDSCQLSATTIFINFMGDNSQATQSKEHPE